MDYMLLGLIARWAIVIGCSGVAIVVPFCVVRDVVREIRTRKLQDYLWRHK
jgi:hypothetical protein